MTAVLEDLGAPAPLRGHWRDRAACLGTATNVFFPDHGQSFGRARGICATCPVREHCLDDALRVEGGSKADHRAGMFGGLNPDERVREHRRRVTGTGTPSGSYVK